jgi:hypothetical protein
MIMRIKDRSYYILGLIFLVSLNFACGTRLNCYSFDFPMRKEYGGDEEQSYVELKDGKKVYGNDISWQTGSLVKNVIKVNGTVYNIDDTRGYFSKGIYYHRYKSEYIKRIIHGKLNVYGTQETASESYTTGLGRQSSRMISRCDYFVQVGDEGELNPITSQKEVARYVKDCPEAVEMAGKKDVYFVKPGGKAEKRYLNEVFELYNNGCK